MRVIAGVLKGRRFHPPHGLPARPTTDFAKESLFNILTNHFVFGDIAFLDLFAGTGNLSYEMASRGCTDIVCVEQDAASAAFIRKTAEGFGISLQVINMDVFHYLRSTKKQFDIIFAGPPYALELIPALYDEVFEIGLLKAGGWFILETNPKLAFDNKPFFLQRRKYGQTVFHIFENSVPGTGKSQDIPENP